MPPWVIVGPGDDAAVVETERGALLVLTTDAQIEGVHFDRRHVPPDAIGHRALAVNLSDLAAMGAQPRTALLSLALPDALEVAVVDGVLDGLLALAARHGVALIGGNVTRSPGPLMLDVTATGSVRPRRILRRAGARSGDEVYVTGTIGDAAVGLAALQGGPGSGPPVWGGPEGPPLRQGEAGIGGNVGTGSDVGADLQVRPRTCIERFLHPEPRVRAGLLLGRNRAATSCVDLSDGLADGVRQLAAASGVGITLDGDAIPISDGTRRWHQERGADPLASALRGGEDYELLFTVRPARRGRLRAVRQLLGDLPITRIGVVTRSRELQLRGRTGSTAMPAGYEHFQRGG